MNAFHIATFLLSVLPVSFLEWLLQACAWLQLYILSAKGAQSKGLLESHEQRKKRKKEKKKGKQKRKKSVDVGLVSAQHMLNEPSQTISSPKMTSAVSEVDVLGDSILFESNERHRREFEGFLRSVKDIKDVNNWLKNFSNEAPKKIAIVKISRRILDTDYGTAQAAAALSFMFKFGLYPIVVHGGWNELSRDTISEVVSRRKIFSSKLKAEIIKCGVSAHVLAHDVCTVEPAINPSTNPFSKKNKKSILSRNGFVSAVGEGRRASLHMEGGLGFQVNSIDSDRLISYLEKGKIPIWDGVAVTTAGMEIPLNGDVTTVELAHLLQPFRIMFACNDGGILDKDNNAIPVVYMDKDYEDLMAAKWVTQRRKIQLLQLRRIVEVVPPTCTVVVTHIESVTHQLMYPRLANETIIRRAEEHHVSSIEDVNKIDKEKLKALIEDSFGRPLAEGYLDHLNDNLYRIYLVTGMDGDYQGCAVILRGVDLDSNSHSDTDSDLSSSTLHSHDGDLDSHHPAPIPRTRAPSPSSSTSSKPPAHLNNHLHPHSYTHLNTNNHHSSHHSPAPSSIGLDSNPLSHSASYTVPHSKSSSASNIHRSASNPTLSSMPNDADSDPHVPQIILENRSRNDMQRPYHVHPHTSELQHSISSSTTDFSDAVSSNSSDNNEMIFYYLCKFCVRKSAQGAGLGDLLWRCIQRDIDKLYWRSRTNNPLNAWYYARCQGSFRTDAHFTIFWYGDDRFEDGASLITDALSRPVTILPAPT